MLKDPSVKCVAVVGASRNPNKWGHKVFQTLINYYPNIRTYPVNPKADEILGHKAYPDIRSLPEKPDMIITVVPPKITEKVVRDAIELGVRIIWMQPGSESDNAIKLAKQNGIKVISGACFIETSKDTGGKIYFKVGRDVK